MTRRFFRHFRKSRYALRIWRWRLMLWSGAIVVALVAIAFAELTTGSTMLFARMVQIHPALPIVVTPLGFAAVAWLTRKFFRGSEGSGIPQTIAALQLPEIGARRSVLSMRIALGKVMLTTLALGAGASVGREGPTVQIGAAIMHSVGRFARLPQTDINRTLILAGGAAGIAAAFNTPLAGIVFAIEELSRSFEERTSGTVLTAVIVSGVTAMAMLGNYTYFGHTSAVLSVMEAWKPVLLCGVVGGVVGALFAKVLIGFSRGLPGLAGRMLRTQPIGFAALCGLILACLGLASGNSVYGTGYEEARMLIEGAGKLPDGYAPMKILATIVSYVAGLPGGIFAPSLAVGAGIGDMLAQFVPEAPAAALVILGMAAYFTGVVQAPITAVVIVMEMTDNQTLTLPLMAASFIAFGASRLICPQPLYRTLAIGFLEKVRRHHERGAPEPAMQVPPVPPQIP